MKIAFVVSFFDFRNDVRRVIADLATRREVVVLGSAKEEASIRAHLPEGVEFRVLRERQGTLLDGFWERIYLLFRQIPKSENNYYLMQLFLASNAATDTLRKKAMRILNWTRRLPKTFSYDAYLDKLQYSGRTPIDDIAQFFLYTNIADDFLLARLLKENRATYVYVYSWDHPCKHPKFSRRVKYLCWSEGIKQDVAELQEVPLSSIKVVGASQFCYIYDFLHRDQVLIRTFPYKYVYFGCAVGITELARQEVEVIRQVALVLADCRPDLTLVVRPYPMMKDWTLYNEIRELSNVVFDEDFRKPDFSVPERAIVEKFEKIHFAEAFLHLGTTMGLEACFTETPSFILDFGYSPQNALSLHDFIHQFQNDRHLIDLGPKNFISSREALRTMLLHPGDPAFQELNQRVQQQYTLRSFAAFSEEITQLATENVGSK